MGRRHERVAAEDPKGPDVLLDPIRNGVPKVERPVLVEVDDEADAAFAVGRAGATHRTDSNAVSDADDAPWSAGAAIRRGGGIRIAHGIMFYF